MFYDTCLSVHRPRCPNHFSAKTTRHTLHSQAYSKNGRLRAETEKNIRAYAKIQWVAGVSRSGRNNNLVVSPFFNFMNGNGIVPQYVQFEFPSSIKKNLTDVLIEIKGKRIVIVYY